MHLVSSLHGKKVRKQWKQWQTVFLGSKISADGDCSYEIKRCLPLGRKAVTNLHSILKNWDVTLPTKVHLVKAMVFPVVMYGCESWTIRKLSAEELVLLNCGVGEDSWESLGLQGDQTSHFYRKLFLHIIGRTVLKLKLQYFGHLMERTDSLEIPWCWERLKARGEGDNRGWDSWMASPTRWTWVWVDSGCWWWTGRPLMLQFTGSQRVGHDWANELNWARTYWK